MSKDSKDPGDLRNMDVRHVERALKRGHLTRKEYDKHLKTLPDVTDKAKPLGDMADVGADDDLGN